MKYRSGYYPPAEASVDRASWLVRLARRDNEDPQDIVQTPEEFTPEFVDRIQAGDSGAEERLLARLRPILHTYFIKRVGLKPEVEDLIQNTLLRVHRGLSDLQRSDRFMGFAMKAALYELHDLYRGRYGGREVLYDPADPPKEAAGTTNSAESIDVQRALGTLSPRARQILELREYGYRYKEIADMIHTSEAAVKMQVKRAFERMRRLLVA
ncbi:MAG TPA: sigma-70 family RNA polymerase sigma factor [Rhodothermales bacterium]|nr:sigma-70 family RNA polymerase sigma factor [Rhodothermales bacterium]